MAMFTPQALKDLDTSKGQEAPKGRFPTAAMVVLLVLTALAVVGAYLVGRS